MNSVWTADSTAVGRHAPLVGTLVHEQARQLLGQFGDGKLLQVAQDRADGPHRSRADAKADVFDYIEVFYVLQRKTRH